MSHVTMLPAAETHSVTHNRTNMSALLWSETELRTRLHQGLQRY